VRKRQPWTNISLSLTCRKHEKGEQNMKQITTFTKNYVNALFQGKVEKPGPGDCWYCAMHTVEDNKPLGEAINSPSHLREHVRERYYVPSLLWNAISTFPVYRRWPNGLWEAYGASVSHLQALRALPVPSSGAH
jgi:hypothetical protein